MEWLTNPPVFLVNSLVGLYLLIVTTQHFPGESCRSVLLNEWRVWPWVTYLGLQQSWKMFAPEVPRALRKLQAILVTAEGETIVWEPPDFAALSCWQGFVHDHYRKYIEQVLTNEQRAYHRPALCEYLVRKYGEQGKKVVKVELVNCIRSIPPFGTTAEPPALERKVIHTLLV